MSFDPIDDDKTFLETFGLAIAVGIFVVLASGIGLGFYFFHGKIPPPKKPEEIMVKLLPPPPMPPPPPPPPPPPKITPPEQKMVEQPKVVKPEPKPEAKLYKPPGPPGPKASGPPSDEGIGGTGGDNGIGGSGLTGSKYGWYAVRVQEAVADALRRNAKTRDAKLHLQVRIWSDATGRITSALLAESTGDPAMDAAIKDQVLTGLTLPEGLPADMPMPIVLRLSAQRPN